MGSYLLLVFGFLLVALFISYDLYTYGVDLKHTPLLTSPALLVIQAHIASDGDRQLIRANCPEITQFRPTSIYADYFEIPLQDWTNCIEKVAPSSLVRNACLETEQQAFLLLSNVNRKNEIVLGLEKYGIRFERTPTYKRMADFADNNYCVDAVRGFAEQHNLNINFKSSQLLDTEKFSQGVSEIKPEELVRLATEGIRQPAAFDYRVSSLVIISGIFIFIILVYTVYMQVRQRPGE